MTAPLARPAGLLTMAEAAARLGMSRDAARQVFKRNHQARKVGGRWFVPELWVREYRRRLPQGIARGDSRTLAAALGISTEAARKRMRRSRGELGHKRRGRWVFYYATASWVLISPEDL